MNAQLAAVLDEERRIMDGWAPHYDAAMLSNAYLYRLERSDFARWITETVERDGLDPASVSLLDAGCGTGGLLELLSRQGFSRLTGLDLAERMLEVAGSRLPDAQFEHVTIERHPFEGRSFDLIVACFTVHHLLDPGSFFRLVDETLRPGGWFFVLEYDGSSAATTNGSEHVARAASRSAGDLVRAAFARKNERALGSLPKIPRLFNPAHRLLGRDELRGALARPEEYELRLRSRGALLPALLHVLVEQSALDRQLVRCVRPFDSRLAARRGGLFQWLAGRRARAQPFRATTAR